ncbi:uncharacterized protein CIMG_13485 [Coccidioides immitis RS]|uniref:Uncharacterized protein n=1 Tax=Coccidioides immitis (strain RS) TaxID=246410 RepID=J3K0A4_COCIM|nr:uncharacterized protein CIMG_13485 [Coccidioides immitis RS]EAS27258.3 hypothetical protein CIMG_13485 [Coccidioides immitis RS]
MELPPNHHHDVLCSLEPKVRDKLQQHEKHEIQQLKDSYMRSLQEWKKHTLLNLMKTEQHKLKLTDKEMMENEWHAGGDKKILYIHAIDALANSSSKCHAIQHILQGMGRDYCGHPEKIIILTEFPCVVHMLELQKQGYCIAAVYSSILISTLEILGIGYTCVCAFQLILLSPSWLERDKTQDKACIHHYRQMNEAMYIYHLVCRDVQVKSNILDQQAMQKSFNKLAMLLQREISIVSDIIDLDTV